MNICGFNPQTRHESEIAPNRCQSPWQQGLAAAEALCRVWSCDDLAQKLGPQLGVGALLQRPLPQRGTP